ncbi:MAG TPA: metal ABC transporter ATP-binding protein [Saprospiraceae bacterium]|nr:metal ABC transporter ATP-binding protein [Saprospiraceae bacterium]
MSKNYSIQVDGLSVSYNRKRVLANIFFHAEPGHIYGVIGPNGAGKSTLFKAILGLIDINAGRIKVLGSDMNDVRKKVSYVPQKDEVDWSFPATVMDIVLQGRYPYRSIWQRMTREDRKWAHEAMIDLGIDDLHDRQIGELSGGQQQRVFLARALCQAPEIYFLDEPFVGVDMLTEEKIIVLLRKLAESGKTIMVIHHDLSSVHTYFDKVILLNQRLIAFGDTHEVFHDINIRNTYGPQLTILHKTRL